MSPVARARRPRHSASKKKRVKVTAQEERQWWSDSLRYRVFRVGCLRNSNGSGEPTARCSIELDGWSPVDFSARFSDWPVVPYDSRIRTEPEPTGFVRWRHLRNHTDDITRAVKHHTKSHMEVRRLAVDMDRGGEMIDKWCKFGELWPTRANGGGLRMTHTIKMIVEMVVVLRVCMGRQIGKQCSVTLFVTSASYDPTTGYGLQLDSPLDRIPYYKDLVMPAAKIYGDKLRVKFGFV